MPRPKAAHQAGATIMGKPVVAIVGRPNVGKSTLFNRLVGGRQAITEDVPGTTRDRLYGEVEYRDHTFALVDTGGLEPDATEGYSALIRQQVEKAVAEADVLLFVVDAPSGLTATDREIAEVLRRTTKPVILVANKVDNEARGETTVEFFELGLGEPVPVSAYHGLGAREVLEQVSVLLPDARQESSADTLKLAVVGRPNVGKSALINAILGQERVIVSEEAGTTRDAVDTPFVFRDKPLVLIDTAGIRRRGRVERGVEKYSVMRAREAIERCDIAVLVMDAEQGVAAQDLHVAGYVVEAVKGMIVAVNKWDLMEDSEEERSRFRKASVVAPAVHSLGAARVRFGERRAECGGIAGARSRNRRDAIAADTDSGGQFGAARSRRGQPAALARPAADADQVRHAGFDSTAYVRVLRKRR